MQVVVIPALDCQASLDGVLAEIPAPFHTLVVDDGSAVPLRAPHVVRHHLNRGYGAAQKSGYVAALAAGATRVILLHGDGQYDTAETLALADALTDADAALGSRFLADPSVIPTWRRLGNTLLTGLANLRFGAAHTELHTGARAFRADVLTRMPLASFSDDYLFDQQLLCWLLRARLAIAERPVHVRYDPTVQSIPLGRSIVYAAGCIREILKS